MFLKMNAQQGRTLAMLLSAMTCIPHLLILLAILHVSLSSHNASVDIRISSPYFAWYNTVAACASMAGMLGAVRMNPTLVTAYTMVHALTLSFLSLTLLNIFLPFRIDTVVPFLPKYKIDSSAVCSELDGAWDESWLEGCDVGFMVVKLVIAVVSWCMMSAQWFALYKVWNWANEVAAEEHREEGLDVEKAEIVDYFGTIEKNGIKL